jgi:hypothetical protein
MSKLMLQETWQRRGGRKGVTRKVNTPERPLDTGVRLPDEIFAHGYSRNSFDRRISTSE